MKIAQIFSMKKDNLNALNKATESVDAIRFGPYFTIGVLFVQSGTSKLKIL